MTDPVRNGLCSHVYDRAGIMLLNRPGKPWLCPIAGAYRPLVDATAAVGGGGWLRHRSCAKAMSFLCPNTRPLIPRPNPGRRPRFGLFARLTGGVPSSNTHLLQTRDTTTGARHRSYLAYPLATATATATARASHPALVAQAARSRSRTSRRTRRRASTWTSWRGRRRRAGSRTRRQRAPGTTRMTTMTTECQSCQARHAGGMCFTPPPTVLPPQMALRCMCERWMITTCMLRVVSTQLNSGAAKRCSVRCSRSRFCAPFPAGARLLSRRDHSCWHGCS
jgi:hypothetical protein